MTIETDNTLDDPRQRATLITGETGQSLHAVTAGVAGVAEAAHAAAGLVRGHGLFACACWARWA